MKDAEEYLMQPKEITARISNRNEKIETLRSVAMKTTPSLHLTGAVSGGGEGHKMENIIAEIDRLERENAADEQELAQTGIRVMDLLNSVENENQRRVLRLSYVEMQKTADIAQMMYMSPSHINSLKKAGLRCLAASAVRSAGDSFIPSGSCS